MSHLPDLQREFARALLDPDRDVPELITSRHRDRPKRRFDVYRNNVVASLIDVLQGHFPVVCRLVGEEFFRATARAYLNVEQPSTPVLAEFGETFADFLQNFEPLNELPYLADVARFEWLQVEALHAGDAQPLTALDLAGIDPADVGQVIFKLHPSTRLITSPYPVVSLWRANMQDEKHAPVDPDAGGEDAAVLRPALDVIYLRLRPGGVAFLAAIMAGAGLADAAQKALDTATDFDVQKALAQYIDAGMLSGWHLQSQVVHEGGER